MAYPDTDYLIVGAGATGLAFADTLLQESDAHITIVDQGALPGGHWNDAYPFVTLHQPSAFYGVASMALGADRLDTVGPNAGLYELASGAEVSVAGRTLRATMGVTTPSDTTNLSASSTEMSSSRSSACGTITV